MATIDKVCKEEANSFILFDPDIVKGLFRRGLIYFDVPVYPDDRFKGTLDLLLVSLVFYTFSSICIHLAEVYLNFFFSPFFYLSRLSFCSYCFCYH